MKTDDWLRRRLQGKSQREEEEGSSVSLKYET